MRQRLAQGRTMIADTVGADEIVLMLGLALLAIGGWMAWRPAACLLPATVLLWMSVPPRRPPADTASSSRRSA